MLSPINPLRSGRFDVLVVDDDEGARELLLSYIGNLGIPVTGAHDGGAAIAILQRSSGRYGLVVTDLNLPGADGFAVLQAARQANSSCYVVIVTGYASLDSAILAVRVGAYDFLTKPFSLGQLEVILKRIGDRASLERENRDPSHTLEAAPVARSNAAPLEEGRLASRDAAVPGSAKPTESASLEHRVTKLEETLERIQAGLAMTYSMPLNRL